MKTKPKVLLIEAGGPNTSEDARFLAERYMVFMNPELNYGYQSEPQIRLANRIIDQSRGKGLGGSSTINFGHWTVGGRDDWDRWARLVDDETFGWTNMKERIKKLENFRPPTADAMRQWVKPRDQDHGHEGFLPIEYPDTVEEAFSSYMKAAEQCISPLNPDVNSGDPIGLAVSAATAKKGVRFSGNWTFIQGAPDNLEVLTGKQVSRVIFDGQRAIGVEADGLKCRLKPSMPTP
jgi:choline dehydrogenase-like flavoprotein